MHAKEMQKIFTVCEMITLDLFSSFKTIRVQFLTVRHFEHFFYLKIYILNYKTCIFLNFHIFHLNIFRFLQQTKKTNYVIQYFQMNLKSHDLNIHIRIYIS